MAKKLYYKIGEACKELDIQPYVLRYWETEFQALSPSKSKSGQRVYSAQDLELIRRIKELLYEEGYTIAGAKKKVEAEVVSRPKAVEAPHEEPADANGTKAAAATDDEGDESEEEAVEEPAPKVKPATKKTRKKATKPAGTPAASSAADTARITRMQKGIRSALKDVKDIFDILDRA